jgi:hypothetical protein
MSSGGVMATFMSKEQVEEVMAFVRSVEVPRETLLCNLNFLEASNRKLWEAKKEAEGLLESHASVPASRWGRLKMLLREMRDVVLGREHSGRAAAKAWLKKHKEKKEKDEERA